MRGVRYFALCGVVAIAVETGVFDQYLMTAHNADCPHFSEEDVNVDAIIPMAEARVSDLTETIVVDDDAPDVDEELVVLSKFAPVEFDCLAALRHRDPGRQRNVTLSGTFIDGEIIELVALIQGMGDNPSDFFCWQIADVANGYVGVARICAAGRNYPGGFSSEIGALQNASIASLGISALRGHNPESNCGDSENARKNDKPKSEIGRGVLLGLFPKPVLAFLLGGMIVGLMIVGGVLLLG